VILRSAPAGREVNDNSQDVRPPPILLRPDINPANNNNEKWRYFSFGAVTGAILAVIGISFWTFHDEPRLSTKVESLRHACRKSRGWETASEFFIERPELVLAEWGEPECVAYVKAIMSPALERQLNNVRLELIARSAKASP
jgi:hypothetical protein